MSIADRLKALRAARGVTQKQLSESTGLPLSSIVNYENGRREPNARAMARLEQYYSVNGAVLHGLEGAAQAEQDLRALLRPAKTEQELQQCEKMVSVFLSLPAASRERAINLLEEFRFLEEHYRK